ncbi:hypothetical protein HRJ34_15720 [Rhizorhabdus wittichii]|uniref:Phosphoadenosine phosphosulphate reductase domain-containing protein n=1 Tax=Rhizorhabdus wittichii TaxID=160791 RepID=A0A975HC42_9SPHN|nr:hypothetical protein [Rhizorhabdus wittichii]QTH19692.1 hypothetical protein HRJ34_15070 [Rhizorhabdus wittichii]QTH19812.1 hypothetical protein HRJ34_15720 [Rhizorhabdus wittichii]
MSGLLHLAEPDSRRFVMFSGGEGSYRAAKIVRARHPEAPLGLVFTDTLYEDADTYRFLIEAAADVFDRRLNWTVRAEDFPDYRVAEDVPIEEYRGNPEWRAFLADLRARTMEAIPELVWLVEGRDVWEVFRDERFLGNSSVDPCSKILKRQMADAWRSGNCRRIGELFGPPDVFSVGIGDHEAHRYDDGKGRGIGPRTAEDGWIYDAPLLTDPSDFPSFFMAPIETFGLRRCRLYGMGYGHGNCGGFCCKAGQAHYANRFKVQPERFAYDAMMERKVGAFLGAEVSMLTDRRGGDGKKVLTLDAFAQRLIAEPGTVYEYEPGDAGCACFGVAG